MIFLSKFKMLKLCHRNYVKYLGVLIDENLSWDQHVKDLSNKLSRANEIISKLRHYAPKECSTICISCYILFTHDVWLLCMVSYD